MRRVLIVESLEAKLALTAGTIAGNELVNYYDSLVVIPTTPPPAIIQPPPAWMDPTNVDQPLDQIAPPQAPTSPY